MSNLPWCMDLIFQVPMWYYSLQHWILLSSPDTSTTERHFCFGPATSFFLGLLLVVFHSSPVAYWKPSDLGDIFQCHIFSSFYTVHEVLTASTLGWFAIPSSLFTIRELQIETTMRYYYLPVRKAKIRNNYNIKCQQWCRETASLIYCWHESKMVQPLWKTVRQCLKLNM